MDNDNKVYLLMLDLGTEGSMIVDVYSTKEKVIAAQREHEEKAPYRRAYRYFYISKPLL